MKKTVLVFCAHSDDQIFGPGGTIAKYAKDGIKIISIILSYGESSHPWLKKNVTINMRVKEADEANKVIKGNKVVFLGLKEGHFISGLTNAKVRKKVKDIIKKEKPGKIFTHSDEDPHPDHRATVNGLLDILDNIKYKCDVYTFDVWSPFNLKKKDFPRMYVDITDTFKFKIKALKCFSSQWMALISLLWSVYVLAIKHGFRSKGFFAERFYKIR